VLQCFTVCCDKCVKDGEYTEVRVLDVELQCVAVCGSVSTVCCNVLQCVAVCCSVVQCVAVCCSVT